MANLAHQSTRHCTVTSVPKVSSFPLMSRMPIESSDPHEVFSSQLCLRYDEDSRDHVMIINDWLHQMASSLESADIHEFAVNGPNNLLINGKGQFENSGESGTLSLKMRFAQRRFYFRLNFLRKTIHSIHTKFLPK